MFTPQDHYFKKAKEKWFKARSAFKLEEIENKFHIFDKNIKNIIDIGCAPWSRIQYSYAQMTRLKVNQFKIIWFDIKDIDIKLENVTTYNQDITDQEKVKSILSENKIEKVDLILSDMAPNTTWIKDIDAIRSFQLLNQLFWMYQDILKHEWKLILKLFMWPWFDKFILELKKIFGWKNIKTFKPKSCRKESKEIYIIKV